RSSDLTCRSRSTWPELCVSGESTRRTASARGAGPQSSRAPSRRPSCGSSTAAPAGLLSDPETPTSEENTMASWPTAPDVQGNGATENDLRRIIGAQYMNQGILPNGGLTVSGRSDMSYLVESGAAFMWTSKSERLGVLVPVETVTIPTEAAPASGSRTDSIYMLRDGIPRVTSGAPPSTGVLLGSFIIGAGVTSTSAGQKTIDREYAIATGTSLGELVHWNGEGIVSWTETMPTQRFAQQFVLPSDRM